MTSRDTLARCLAEVGAFTEGMAHGEESLRIAETVNHPNSLIVACYVIGHVYLYKGAWHQAIPWLERGLEVCKVWTIRSCCPSALRPLAMHMSSLDGCPTPCRCLSSVSRRMQ